MRYYMFMVDFSQFPENKVFMKRTPAWIHMFNIPVGGSLYRDARADRDVLRLQRKHGCANVISGNAEPLSCGRSRSREIGVYVYPHGVRHRIDGIGYNGKVYKLCKCNEPA